jgi:DNA repair protein RadD
MITLRYYQQEAVDAAWQALRQREHPVIQCPTGSGKSLIIAELVRRVAERGGRVLIATHVQELVEGNAKEFHNLTGIEPGILCAGLARTDKGHDVLFASVQSLYKPAKNGEIAPFDLIVVDECHLVQDRESDAKFYPTTFSAFPDAQRVGLSATPFRMDGPVYGEGRFFTEKCYEISVLQLVQDGFLAPLVGINPKLSLDLDKIKKTAGEYDVKSIEDQETDEWLKECVATTIELARGRKHLAVFCPTISVAERAAEIFNYAGLAAATVVADTVDRGDLLGAWKAGSFPVMCSVGILTTGFNFPALDCLVILRPTESLALHQQILGRGTRTADGKKNCLVIDFSGNLVVHGGICVGMEECYTQKDDKMVAVSAQPAPKKEKRKVKTAKELSELDPLLANPKGFRARVLDIGFIVINSKAQPGKRLLMATYDCVTEGGLIVNASCFLCVEYSGFALQQAGNWFKRRGEDSFPRNAEAARSFCWGLPVPREVLIKKNGKYLNIEQEFM